MQRKVRSSTESGFTLIELLIAMVVAVLALVGYIGATTNIQQTGEEAFERSVAIQDANQVVEQIREAAGSGTFPGNVLGSFPNNGTVGGFNNLDSQQITVSYVDTSADPLDTFVVVSWNENGRRATSATLRTFITQRT